MTQDLILVLNAGSSSIKYALYDAADLAEVSPRTTIDVPTKEEYDDRFGEILQSAAAAGNVVGVGHRVVHGGRGFAGPVVLDEASLATVRGLTPLAPLHQPFNLKGIDLAMAAFPGVAQVACFDTAFHRTQPELNQLFAIPRDLTAKGVQRYGFHGLSYEYIAAALPQHTGRASGRVIVMHLGNGASACAIKEGKSISSTMGFTALEGLMMGTRCGAVDPGVILHLLDGEGMSVKDATTLLYKKCGLLGVSGQTADMRKLDLTPGTPGRDAFDLFTHMAARAAGALAVDLSGLDVLVFTAGIGENHAPTRAAICAELAFLGISLDAAANGAKAQRISAAESAVEVLVLPTDEESMIARHTQRLAVGSKAA
ncbi:MAG TPA: acetate kinase [Rhodospirillaceae bacterium]|jgi:acetate kinase|nr:acetate/propionate family kinase [Alphaproteobacteria bacterium]HBH26091.1 acetate kinase [Rhodospirillaceae bacterium]